MGTGSQQEIIRPKSRRRESLRIRPTLKAAFDRRAFADREETAGTLLRCAGGGIKFSCPPAFPVLRAPPQSSTHLWDTVGRCPEHRRGRMKAKSLLTTPGWGGAARAVLSEGPGENTTRRMLAHPLPSQPRTPWGSRKPWGIPRRRGKKSTGSGGSWSGAFQGSALLTSGIQELAGAPRSLTSDLAFRRLSVLTGQTSSGHAKPLHAHATAAHFSSLSLALSCLTPPTFTGPRMGSSVG